MWWAKNGFFPNSYYKAASHRFITFCIGGREYLTPQPPVLLLFFLYFTPEASTDLAFLCSLPLGAEWRNLGARLLVPEHQLNTIQAIHAHSPNHLQDCLNSMFTFWLKNCTEPTCEFLIQAVDAVGRRDVVTMLCLKYYGELVATPGERGSYWINGGFNFAVVCFVSIYVCTFAVGLYYSSIVLIN